MQHRQEKSSTTNSDSSGASCMSTNTLMVMGVGALLDAYRLGLLRSAGRGVGRAAFEELVAIHAIPLCIQLDGISLGVIDDDNDVDDDTTMDHNQKRQCIPLCWNQQQKSDGQYVNLRKDQKPPPLQLSQIIVSQTAMQNRGFILDSLREHTIGGKSVAMRTLTIVVNTTDEDSTLRMIGDTPPDFGRPFLCARHVNLIGSSYYCDTQLHCHDDDADEGVNDAVENEKEAERADSDANTHHHTQRSHLYRHCPISTLKTIGDSLLEECTLSTITLHPTTFANVTHIGDDFMFCCESLKSIDLTVFGSVTHIGERFLTCCEALEVISLSPTTFSHLSFVGSRFISTCSSLRKINLQSLTLLSATGIEFMAECSSLEAVEILPSGLKNIKSVDDSFMRRCTSLSSIDLSCFINAERIGSNFLGGCTALTSVDLTPLGGSRGGDSSSADGGKLRTVGDYFMAGCSSLISVNASSLNGVSGSADGMFEGCHKDLEVTGMSEDQYGKPSDDKKAVRLQAICDSLK